MNVFLAIKSPRAHMVEQKDLKLVYDYHTFYEIIMHIFLHSVSSQILFFSFLFIYFRILQGYKRVLKLNIIFNSFVSFISFSKSVLLSLPIPPSCHLHCALLAPRADLLGSHLDHSSPSCLISQAYLVSLNPSSLAFPESAFNFCLVTPPFKKKKNVFFYYNIKAKHGFSRVSKMCPYPSSLRLYCFLISQFIPVVLSPCLEFPFCTSISKSLSHFKALPNLNFSTYPYVTACHSLNSHPSNHVH